MKKRIFLWLPFFVLTLAILACTAMESTAPSLAARKKTAFTLRLNRKKLSVTVGQVSTLKAKVKPAKSKVTWKSSKRKVASISSKGKIKAKKKGTTIITATARNKGKTKKAVCKVSVKGKTTQNASPNNSTQTNISVQQITTSQTSYTLEVGRSILLNASVSPANASNKKLFYVCDNPSVATVDSNGKIQSIKEGTVNITIKTSDGSEIRKVIQVNVVAPISSMSLKEESITLTIGETYTLEPELAPVGASLHSCHIVNSKDYIASVASDGKITAKYPGIAIVTISSITNPSVSCQLRINVTDDFAPAEGFDQYDDTIEHGTLKGLNYASDYRSTGRAHALMWLPPDYDEDKQYNLLFCLHGGNDNEYYWTSDQGGTNDGCSADKVLDNAYAKGLIEDTIVVFTSGVITYDTEKDYPNIVENPLLTDFWKNHFLLEFEIINNLLPYMQQEYPVMTGPEHTGICGLSMGCAQTMEIGLKHPDLFGYVGCFSAGPFETTEQPFVTSKEDAQLLNSKLKLLFFITGENDHMMDDSMRNFINTCDGFGLNHIFYEVPGRGHDDPCWDRCLYAFMKYAFK